MPERRGNPKTRPQREYEKRATVPMQIRFNIKTDADIIARLAEQNNKQGYIKRLIREDIAAGNVAGWREDVISALETLYTVERAESGALIFTPKK
jgi:hypothetical protein